MGAGGSGCLLGIGVDIVILKCITMIVKLIEGKKNGNIKHGGSGESGAGEVEKVRKQFRCS